MTGFEKGYRLAHNHIGAASGAFDGADYISSINLEIEKIAKNINKFEGYSTGIHQLKGNASEFWHSGTHNINAAINGSGIRTTVDESRAFASADISSTDGKSYGLKYMKSAEATAESQSRILGEEFKRHSAEVMNQGKEAPTFEEYLAKRNLPEGADFTDPMYAGQIRVVPKEQLDDAIQFLKEKIAKEQLTRPELVRRYQETLESVTDKVTTADGAESIALDTEEAVELAKLAKEGGFKPEDFGLTTEDMIDAHAVMNHALKAGVTAAVITLALKLAPEVYKAIDMMVREGAVDEKQFRAMGLAAVSGAGEGFLRGSVAASITASCHAGLLGPTLKDVKPGVVAVVTVLALDTMKNSFLVANGRMSKGEMTDKLVRAVYSSTGALALGTLGASLVPQAPVLGYMLGSFVGSTLGSFAYSASYNTYISFAIENGTIFFGIVEQDYFLPSQILEEIGVEVFEYEKFEPMKFRAHEFKPRSFQTRKFEPRSIDITFLRRGVIGVNQVGYVR